MSKVTPPVSDANLFAALRAAFPADLDAVAIEADDGLNYSWRDLERATAMLANLLASLELPEGARIAVQVDGQIKTGRDVAIGAVYATLERLEARKLFASIPGVPGTDPRCPPRAGTAAARPGGRPTDRPRRRGAVGAHPGHGPLGRGTGGHGNPDQRRPPGAAGPAGHRERHRGRAA